MSAKQWIIETIEKKSPALTAAADAIWDYAETRFESPRSAGELCKLLEVEGFRIERGISGMADAFIATFGSGKPAVGILAEFDALPGMSQVCDLTHQQAAETDAAGHGCGHHVLGVGAVAGALGIADYLKQQKRPGEIILFGCPAEESGYGKAYMAREGIFARADALLSWHPMNMTSGWGFSTLAVNQLYFDFKGVASHAGASPELGRSALDAAELMNVGVQFLREHIQDNARIHYAFMDVGGRSANVVQASASLHYFIRAPKQDEARAITERVIRIAEGAALMTDTELAVRWDSAAADYVVNRTLTDVMYENLRQVAPLQFSEDDLAYARPFFESQGAIVTDRLVAQYRATFPDATAEEIAAMATAPLNATLAPLAYPERPITGSTDVGDASWIAPTAQVTVAYGPNGSSPHCWQWVAVGKSAIAHKALLTAGKVIAMTALDLIETPDIIKSAWEEHRKNLGGKSYQSALPDSVRPR